MKGNIRTQSSVNTRIKGESQMVKVTKAEKESILQHFPNTHIRRTMKHKSGRHCYFCEESYKIVEFLRWYRNKHIVCPESGC